MTLRLDLVFGKLPVKKEFDTKFATWRNYYDEVEIYEVITPLEAMNILFSQLFTKRTAT
jgi:hypothetical protein